MKTLLAVSMVSATILGLAGCNTSQSLPPTGSVPTTSPNPNARVETHSNSVATQVGQPAPKSTTTENGAQAPHELIAGIKNPGIVPVFESARKQAAENPTDWQAQLQYVNLLQTIGNERMKLKESAKAYSTFAESAAVARKFLETKSELPAAAHGVLAAVFYNEACVAGRANNPSAAIGSIEEAIKWGFSDFALMESDEDLAAVRQSAEFSPKLARWKQAAREASMKHAKEELASAESFPFDFALTDVTGKALTLAEHHGKVLIVDIWGTWCPPCRAEIPSFVKLQQTFGEKGFQMIGLNKENGSGDEARQKVTSFMAEQGMNYPCAMIDDATIKQVPNLEGFPTTLFLDRTGKVRLKVVGLHEYSYLEAVVLALLDEPAPPAPATGGD